jgi:hyperosmotically inducible protein
MLAGCDRAEEDRAAQAASDAVRQTNQALSQAEQAVRQAGGKAAEGAGEAGRMLRDGSLTARVKTALLADENVPASQIDVDSNDGVVTLSGRLSSEAQVQRALEIARKVDGVQRVDNKLTAG